MALPRLPKGVSITSAKGWASDVFQRWWQTVAESVDGSITGLTATVVAVVAAQADADAAQLNADALETPSYLTVANTALLASERRLTGAAGITFTDGGAGSTYQINVNVSTVLGYTPANKAGETFTGAVDVQAALRADSLRLDQAATASVATITHTTPIDINGTIYYLMLSNVP